MTTGRGIIELMGIMKTQGGNCSFSTCMEAYFTEVKDRSTRTERLKVEPVIHIDGEVGVEPVVKQQVIVGNCFRFCIDI
jgi:hypothetical protein